mgnify:CR=1 FL=1
MGEYWLNLEDVPEEGKEYHLAEPTIWSEPLEEFDLPYAMQNPLQAELFILPQEKGCLVRGRFWGSVSLPCDRCAEAYEFLVDAGFEIFEELQPSSKLEQELGPTFLRQEAEVFFLDVGGILWEQFLLALPVKQVCSSSCAGLCPYCGQNLNKNLCSCEPPPPDPRLEVFRKLKIE